MLQYAVPPGYQRQQPIKQPKLGPWLGVIDAILSDDKQRPAKQRHTAKRIFDRLKDEHQFGGGYTIVKDHVRKLLMVKVDRLRGTDGQMFSYCITETPESQTGQERTNAGGFARRASTTAEGSGVHNDGSDYAGIGDRSDDGDFYARASSDAEVAACDETGRTVAHRG
jgi:hypothetical protein